MIRTVRTRYSGGKLEPLEPLALEEGRELDVSFEDEPAAAGERESLVEMFDRLRKSVPPDAWDVLPTDGAQNYKHYLYGHPKEEERQEVRS